MWLQATSVFSVIAGYIVLLVIHADFADLQRKQAHRQLAAALMQRVEAAEPQIFSVPWQDRGLQVSLLASGPKQEPQLQAGPAGQQWLVSRSPLVLPAGERRSLLVRQNVAQSLAKQRSSQRLLIAAAVVSMLFTSLLLRLVLRRGLVQPLQDLDRQLQGLGHGAGETETFSFAAQRQRHVHLLEKLRRIPVLPPPAKP